MPTYLGQFIVTAISVGLHKEKAHPLMFDQFNICEEYQVVIHHRLVNPVPLIDYVHTQLGVCQASLG